MTLQKIKGFTPNDFSNYHPSGNLGKKLNLTLKYLIDEKRKPMVDKSTSFLNVIDEISSNMYGATAVVDVKNIIVIIEQKKRKMFRIEWENKIKKKIFKKI